MNDRGAAQAPAKDMAWIPTGSFLMGSDEFYPEERPVHPVSVDGFWMDEHLVTVAEFRRFVKATGYVTVAERPLDPADFPGADPAALVPGALVFHRTRGPVDLSDFQNWWAYVRLADLRLDRRRGELQVGRDHLDLGRPARPGSPEPDSGADRAGAVMRRAGHPYERIGSLRNAGSW